MFFFVRVIRRDDPERLHDPLESDPPEVVFVYEDSVCVTIHPFLQSLFGHGLWPLPSHFLHAAMPSQ
jgi:hypothetical protein